ncbi:Nucleotidyltransferase, partial [Punctularia strigosozonata HHB-11173 SS5]
RGKADCGDIDILITRPTYDRRDHRGILRRLLRALREAKIITEDLAVPNYDELDGLEGCYRGLCRLPNVEGAKRRRIDFLTVPWECRGAALLYYTGDDIFNRSMRLKANKMGWSLNQRGLFANVVRDPRDRRVKMTQGKRIAGATEREIFEKLGVPWQEPHERVRN